MCNEGENVFWPQGYEEKKIKEPSEDDLLPFKTVAAAVAFSEENISLAISYPTDIAICHNHRISHEQFLPAWFKVAVPFNRDASALINAARRNPSWLHDILALYNN